jgi:glycosyltransferase involved in cell wall biosynthesis
MISHWKAKGVSRSRNVGAMLATSDNLIFLDADDCLSENYIEAVTDKRVETGADIIYPNVLLWSRWHKDVKLDNAWYESADKITWENMAEYNQLVVTSLIPKSLFVKVNGMDNYPMLEDYDFYLKCLHSGASFYKAPTAILKYRQRENSRNHQANELKNQLYWEIKEKYAEIKKS